VSANIVEFQAKFERANAACADDDRLFSASY
jgi:hypothetical protein